MTNAFRALPAYVVNEERTDYGPMHRPPHCVFSPPGAFPVLVIFPLLFIVGIHMHLCLEASLLRQEGPAKRPGHVTNQKGSVVHGPHPDKISNLSPGHEGARASLKDMRERENGLVYR